MGFKKILIVEDEMIIGAKISMQLTDMGYEVTGILARGEEALVHIRENRPDILLLDIQLKGDLDGIETAREIQLSYDIPIIYITANDDDAFFNRAKHTRPHAFISKPFKKIELQRAIELTIARMEQEEDQVKAAESQGESNENEAWLATLNELVMQHVSDSNLSVDLLADLIHVSRAQFFRRLQALTGLTPLQYIQDIRYNFALQLLKQRRYNNVKSVAAAIGAQKVQYFSEQFKMRYGKSPSEFLD
jgi:YesN/AraC family two-component response regulator